MRTVHEFVHSSVEETERSISSMMFLNCDRRRQACSQHPPGVVLFWGAAFYLLLLPGGLHQPASQDVLEFHVSPLALMLLDFVLPSTMEIDTLTLCLNDLFDSVKL